MSSNVTSPTRTAVMEQPIMLPGGFTIVTRYANPETVVVETFSPNVDRYDEPGAAATFYWALTPEPGAGPVDQAAIDAQVAEQAELLAKLFPKAVTL